jgi:lipopolysaccharide transport protein LptA
MHFYSIYIFVLLLFFDINFSFSANKDFKTEFEENTRIELRADTIIYKKDIKNIELTGNVDIIKGTLNLNSDKVLILYNESINNKIDINTIKCIGNVKAKNKDIVIHSDNAIYNIKENVIILTNNVKIFDNNAVINSDKVVYNVITEKLEVMSKEQENSRVKLVIEDIKKVQKEYGN